MAVADGHGDARHFRSERGARMAAAAGVSAMRDWSAAISGAPAEIRLSAKQALVPDVVARWNAAVAADLSEDPFSEAERGVLADLGLQKEIAYGSTLLIGAFTSEYAVFAQIGDGNIVAVAPEGASLTPVPGDSSLDGRHTTSLCQPDAGAAFRVGVVQLAARPLYAVLIATDGFGNAQAEDPWQPGVAADLVSFGLDHDPDWFASQLPSWAAQCASSNGSGDDSTMALVMNSAVTPGSMAPASPDVTDPVRTRTLELFPPIDDRAAAEDRRRAGSPGDGTHDGAGAGPGTAWRRSLAPWWIAAAIVVVALGLGLALVLRGHGQPRPGPSPVRPSPSASHRPSPTPSASAKPSGSVSPSPSPSRPAASPSASAGHAGANSSPGIAAGAAAGRLSPARGDSRKRSST